MKESGLRNRLINIILVLGSLLIFLILAEVIFRRMLLSTNERFEFLRKPEYYAKIYNDKNKIYTDEYWKLYYKFGGENEPPKKPHPTLGWIFDLDYNTLAHPDAIHLNNRRPVLLYGDSFAHCSPQSICFEKILNNDPEFAKNYYLLNYGMGGYCVGQISLLMEKSKGNYKDPVIIYGFMNRDVDRSILSVRIGQKPCFDVRNDSLIITGLPVEPEPAEFFRKNPVQITSYLYRRFLSSKLNIFPENKKALNRVTGQIKQVNEKIISNTIQDLRYDSDDFFVLVFHALYNDEDDWRNVFLRDLLEREGVQYIWSRDLVDRDTTFKEYHLRDYELSDGHPTTHFNNLIAEEIKKFVLDTAYREQTRKLNTQIYLSKKQAEGN